MANKNKPQAAPAQGAPAQPTVPQVAIVTTLAGANLYRKSKKAKTGAGTGNGKFTRAQAVCMAIQAIQAQGLPLTQTAIIATADSLFTAKTGKGTNAAETYRRYRTIVPVLVLFGAMAQPAKA